MNEPLRIWIPDERPVGWQKFYQGYKHWAPRMREAERCHNLVATFARMLQVKCFDVLVDIQVTVFFDKNIMDSDNINAKFYIDGLILGEIILNDNPNYVRWVSTRSLLANGNPGILIHVFPAKD